MLTLGVGPETCELIEDVEEKDIRRAEAPCEYTCLLEMMRLIQHEKPYLGGGDN
jgi:hypothetical protein